MAPRRIFALIALVLTPALHGAPRTAQAMTLPSPLLEHARTATEIQYYYAPPRRRQVCWNERVRRFVGYDRYGRAVYRTYNRRVCRWR